MTGVATVIPLLRNSGADFSPPRGEDSAADSAPGKVLSLRSRLFERALDEAWAQRMADELRTRRADLGPPRLRVVRP
jgi:hypothetical protein